MAVEVMSAADDARWMMVAMETARRGIAAGQSPFGAVVVRGGAAIGVGHNEVWKRTDITAHAEVVAIQRACAAAGAVDLSGCTIYTTCEPCPMCLAAAYWARVDKLHYACESADAARAGFDDRAIYEELVKGPAERTLLSSQLLRDEALATFQAWIDKSDRVAY